MAVPLGGCGLADLLPEIPFRASAETAVAATASTRPQPPPPPGTRALRVTLGGRTGYATLLQESRGRRLWRTEDNFALATDGARVVATSGQPQMLMATHFDGPDPLAAPEALLEREAPARRLVDLATAARDPAGMRFGLEITCRLGAAPAGEAAPGVLEVEERCRGPAPIGAFTNRFAVRRADGAVLRSEQWIGPGLPMLVLEAVGP